MKLSQEHKLPTVDLIEKYPEHAWQLPFLAEPGLDPFRTVITLLQVDLAVPHMIHMIHMIHVMPHVNPVTVSPQRSFRQA